jgi:UDP-3-O-[3-hydroxymyristoyl] N-acetylglucosamine deacetylase/3-hydroxyacyl-[acyl-carrier-protein] dehydratase
MILMPSTTDLRNQQTLAREAEVRGIGFLTETDVTVRFRPAAPDTGIVFRRVDLPGAPEIPARIGNVVPRQRRTALQCGEATVEMVEHVMAALAGSRVDNCLVDIDAGEAPGCDGSSLTFLRAVTDAGIVAQERPRRTLVIDRPVTVSDGPASLTAFPSNDSRFVLSYHLEYVHPIGNQSRCLSLNPVSFRDEIAPSRTFLLAAEAQAMRQAGLGKRLSESDLLIIGPDGPIRNTLRFPDECVRHKILDMVGDLALAGVDLVGHVIAHRSGHRLNAELVRALLEHAQADRSTGPAQAPITLLDVNQIMKLLPHRYPLLLIDRVTALEPGKRVRAIKNVSINEPFFTGHWPERPIMPGVLILEALAQTAGVLLAQSYGGTNRHALIASIDQVKMRRPVVPGDQLQLDVVARRLGPRMTEVHGEARVDGQLAAEGKIRFVFIVENRVA